MKSIYNFLLLYLFIFCFISTSCRKYLDAKSDQKLVVPTKLQDLQGLLDNYLRINQLDPSSGERCSDDYFLDYSAWQTRDEVDRRAYTWEKSYLFLPGFNNDWAYAYDNVYKANVVLDNLNKIETSPAEKTNWDNLKGQALFIRAKSFLQIAIIWAMPYDESSAATDLGIPLRLDPDFNKPTVRSNLRQTYEQIISDLSQSIEYLPIIQNIQNPAIRPSKPAAYGFLARAYLSMRKYDSAQKYADLCIQLKSSLLDFNDAQWQQPQSAPSTIKIFNPEVIYHAYMTAPSILSRLRARTDSTLYKSYANDDLRKTRFFRPINSGNFGFNAHYSGTAAGFSGIAVDEIYLMRAECYARLGKVSEAMNDLNSLLIKRWKLGTFVSLTATDANDALKQILVERRKELIMRGLRWMDLKRLNKEGASISLTRNLNGQKYILAPNDSRYSLSIPEDVISMTGIQQN